MTDQTIVALVVFGGAAITIGFLMKKRIIRFLRKLGLWKKAQEFKDKPAEPEKPTDPIEEPELPTEPEGLKIPLKTDVDNTAYLREQFKEDNTTYILPKGEFEADGRLPGDTVSKQGFQLGEHGIVRIENRNHIEVLGDETILYTNGASVPSGWVIDGKVYERHPETNIKYPAHNDVNMSQRKFYNIRNSKYVRIAKTGGKSTNFGDVTHPEDMHPRNPYPHLPYYSKWNEFEHLVDINECQFVAIEDMYGGGLWGDGVYIYGSDDVYVRNVTIDGNGRQGGAWVSGKRGYFENYKVLNSRRSFFDTEGDVRDHDTIDFVMAHSYGKAHLAGMPMGGNGLVKNFLSINNHSPSNSILCLGNGNTKLRENIIMKNCNFATLGRYVKTHNILIDNLDPDETNGMNLIEMGHFNTCTNITIRNCNFGKYGYMSDSQEPIVLVRAVNTPLSEFKIYDNKIPVGVISSDFPIVEYADLEPDTWYKVHSHNLDTSRYIYRNFEHGYWSGLVRNKKEIIDLEQMSKDSGEEKYLRFQKIEFPEYTPTEEEKDNIPFETSEYIEFQWNRLKDGTWREYQDDGWRPEWYSQIK